MLMRLNMATRALHPDVDALWVELMSFEATRDAYIEALITTYGFEAPIEAALAMTPGVSSLVELRSRARSGFIVQDLLTLGFSPARIARLPHCCQIVPFRDPGDALGWLYVVERATLLHETVRRHLESLLPELNAFSYLGAYTGVAGVRWQELGHALDFVAMDDEVGEQIIAASRDAFATLRQWVATASAESIRKQLRA